MGSPSGRRRRWRARWHGRVRPQAAPSPAPTSGPWTSKGAASVRLVNLDAPLLAGERVISADDQCEVLVLGSPGFNGDTSGVVLSGDSLVELRGFQLIVAQGNAAFLLGTGSRALHGRRQDPLDRRAAGQGVSAGDDLTLYLREVPQVLGLGGHWISAGGLKTDLDTLTLMHGGPGSGFLAGSREAPDGQGCRHAPG